MQPPPGQIPGYFDAAGNPVYTTKISTVGSASATGSIGGGRTTTWASGSISGDGDADTDKMSTTNERELNEDRFSTTYQSEDGDRMSETADGHVGDASGDAIDDNASLVGFGEGASSTVSGPTYSRIGGPAGSLGAEAAQRIVRERLEQGEAQAGRGMATPETDGKGLGKFYFEDGIAGGSSGRK